MPRDLNHFCLGCYACMKDETKCPFYDEKKIIVDAMNDVDILIFTTPNYCMAPLAPMKAFIDLFFQYWIPHRPRKSMFSKKAVVISTTAGVGAGKAIKPVVRTLVYWGIPYVKSYGLAVQAANWSEVSKSKKEKIEKDIKSMRGKIKEILNRRSSLYQDIKEIIKIINRRLVGFKNYYRLKNAGKQLNKLDGYVLEKFTRWYNHKRQIRPRRRGIKQMYSLLKKEGIVYLAS